jgi:hypothetical protein
MQKYRARVQSLDLDLARNDAEQNVAHLLSKCALDEPVFPNVKFMDLVVDDRPYYAGLRTLIKLTNLKSLKIRWQKWYGSSGHPSNPDPSHTVADSLVIPLITEGSLLRLSVHDHVTGSHVGVETFRHLGHLCEIQLRLSPALDWTLAQHVMTWPTLRKAHFQISLSNGYVDLHLTSPGRDGLAYSTALDLKGHVSSLSNAISVFPDLKFLKSLKLSAFGARRDDDTRGNEWTQLGAVVTRRFSPTLENLHISDDLTVENPMLLSLMIQTFSDCKCIKAFYLGIDSQTVQPNEDDYTVVSNSWPFLEELYFSASTPSYWRPQLFKGAPEPSSLVRYLHGLPSLKRLSLNMHSLSVSYPWSIPWEHSLEKLSIRGQIQEDVDLFVLGAYLQDNFPKLMRVHITDNRDVDRTLESALSIAASLRRAVLREPSPNNVLDPTQLFTISWANDTQSPLWVRQYFLAIPLGSNLCRDVSVHIVNSARTTTDPRSNISLHGSTLLENGQPTQYPKQRPKI